VLSKILEIAAIDSIWCVSMDQDTQFV